MAISSTAPAPNGGGGGGGRAVKPGVAGNAVQPPAGVMSPDIPIPAAIGQAGAWVQLASPASIPADLLLVGFQFSGDRGANPNRLYVEIGTGPAGAEVAVVRAPILQLGAITGPFVPLIFPVRIPAGTRIAARIYSSGLAMNGYVNLHLVDPTVVESF